MVLARPEMPGSSARDPSYEIQANVEPRPSPLQGVQELCISAVAARNLYLNQFGAAMRYGIWGRSALVANNSPSSSELSLDSGFDSVLLLHWMAGH